MFLSVIVPTRDRCELLAKALASFEAQTHPRDAYEVIVVDNGSRDATQSIVEGYVGSLPNLRRLWEPRPGLHRGRHAGLKAARGDVLVYADDDIRAVPTWLEAIARSFEDPKVVLVGGPCVPDYESSPPAWLDRLWSVTGRGRFLTLYSILDLGNERCSIPPWLVFGCNFSIRKATLLEVGGFHPDGMPGELLKLRGDGETAVSKEIERHGWCAIYEPGAAVHHWVSTERMTDAYVYRRAYAQGVSDSYTRVRQARRRRVDWGMLARLGARFASFRVRSAMHRDGAVERALERGYRHGYAFHQRALREDRALLDWVLRDSYLDD